jgi:hypothetical protein
MEYTIKNKPTFYKGIRFRSRLEAQWAAFFDKMGWKWEYEPFDLEGWSPDFLLDAADPILVEVKPISVLSQISTLKKYNHHWFRTILLGVGPASISDGYYNNANYLRIGWINDEWGDWDDLVLKDDRDISNANSTIVNCMNPKSNWRNFATNEEINDCLSKWGEAKRNTTFLKF